MKSKLFKKIIALVVTAAIAAGMVPVGILPAYAADSDGAATAGGINESVMGSATRDDLYQYYIIKYGNEPRPDREIYIAAADYTYTEADEDFNELPEIEINEFVGQSDCLVWKNDLGSINYDFEVNESGLYNLEFFYYPISGKNTTVDLGLLIDGEYPFSAMKEVELDRYWKNSGQIKKDKKDNDILPTQINFEAWITYPIKDKEGLFPEPYSFYLEAGKHTLTLIGVKVNTAFKSMMFRNYPELPSYDDIRPTQEQINATPALSTSYPNPVESSTIYLEAETPTWKSSGELAPTYDRANYHIIPRHPVKVRYNTVGGFETWSQAAQMITWDFVIPNDGYYRFSVKYRQDILRGFMSNRRVYIDGEVPCKEFDCQEFPYDLKWRQKCLGVGDGQGKTKEDIYIYLTRGNHTLSMECVPGDIGETMQNLEEIIFTLNYYYRRILMITGPTPDEFNLYFVDKQIPELLPSFADIIDRLYAEKANIEKISSGSEASTLQTMAVILQRCIDEPDRIPQMRQTIKDNITALSAWMREKTYQPLELDYIEIATAHEEFKSDKTSFWESFVFGFRGFIGSFFERYDVIDDGEGINVWVGLGRDQALIVKELIDNDFNITHEKTPAIINLVQGSILEASLAGKGPEIAMFIGGDFPVQLALRGLTVDLTKFWNYEEIIKERFTEQLPVYYTYEGGVYGLPISQNFPMMFYRSDILEELNLEPPETWDDFINAIAILQRAYLGIGLLPPTSNLSSTTFEPGDTFTLLQLQTGLNFYTEDLSRTTLDEEASIEAFTLWTKFYSIYKFDQTYDAFSRFRTGEMPIVIQNYTFFNMLSAAAPEIKGLWDFQHVPGTRRIDENGNEIVDFAACSGGSGAVIFEKVQDKSAAWEFITWFTSDEIQTQFGKTMEALVGPLGRFDTANKNAFEQLSWSTVELQKLTEQRDALVEIPMIPANYATTRHLKNAFRAVVNDFWTPRYALSAYNRDINAEITRKNEEIKDFKKNE